MKTLKTVKKALKAKKLWKPYLKKFHHHQMRLLFSKIVLIFKSNINPDWLVKQEISLLKTPIGPKMFQDVFENFQKLNQDQYNWNAFSHFIWYIFQTSTFYHDQKHNITNVFNENNYIEINAIKRDYYYSWLETLDPKLTDYNQLIVKVLKRVF